MGRTRRQGAKSVLAITGLPNIGCADLLEGGADEGPHRQLIIDDRIADGKGRRRDLSGQCDDKDAGRKPVGSRPDDLAGQGGLTRPGGLEENGAPCGSAFEHSLPNSRRLGVRSKGHLTRKPSTGKSQRT